MKISYTRKTHCLDSKPSTINPEGINLLHPIPESINHIHFFPSVLSLVQAGESSYACTHEYICSHGKAGAFLKYHREYVLSYIGLRTKVLCLKCNYV
jgi:hypothetical protein